MESHALPANTSSGFVIADALNDPFYYLVNFESVLDWVRRHHHDLLTTEELTFLATFPELPLASRALLVRMVMRKGELFRRSKLVYTEIGDSEAACASLIAHGWVEREPAIELTALFELTTRAELTRAFRPWLERSGVRKAALLEQLEAHFVEPRSLGEWLPDEGDRLYRLTIMPLCERLRLMFFGNLRQSWSEFILADLGIYRFETVELTAASRAFHSRAAVDGYLELHRCRERLENGEAPHLIADDVPPVPDDNVWLQGRRDRLLYRLARESERAGDYTTAASLYAESGYPDARLRRIRTLERLKAFEQAHRLGEQAEAEPESDSEIQQLARIMPRLRRQLGMPKLPIAETGPIDAFELTLPRPTHGSVELAVRDHLHIDQAPVYYVENSLVNSLFGLLCWEAIFAPVPGAFFHPFHAGPADLHQPGFRARRAALFERCLARLDNGEWGEVIRANLAGKWGLQSPFVHWSALSEPLLERALAHLPPAHLRLWFERLLQDIRPNRAGFPDLIRFTHETPGYEMIEVKGPGDRLQDNQRRWIDFCRRHAMPVRVCHVRWVNA
ncbi:VRR-NUC domain-containing protein [Kushneria phosphatilytica]|uniref:phosphodiesterase I n=1 Tax=Kushneria phosphatilytica TaxID=657387 RepID=A0A1S1NL97_9GAMM|nr:VRR-NUC domain-containing protein [Kushneria phosphatilytica]OHV07521.1 nuclease [Kushneria phosphatilytica]QEL10004.1 VRR-NUC domain-containing protein [Kushneria phosphatilytica]